MAAPAPPPPQAPALTPLPGAYEAWAVQRLEKALKKIISGALVRVKFKVGTYNTVAELLQSVEYSEYRLRQPSDDPLVVAARAQADAFRLRHPQGGPPASPAAQLATHKARAEELCRRCVCLCCGVRVVRRRARVLRGCAPVPVCCARCDPAQCAARPPRS